MVDAQPQATGFPGKDPNEHLQFYFRQHWIRMLWPFCRTVIFTSLLLFIGYALFILTGIPDPTIRRAFLLLLLFFVALVQFEFLLRFYRYFLYVIIATDRSIHRIKKTLFTVDDHESIDLTILQDIQKSQHGLFQNLFGFGTLILEAQDTVLRLHFAPHISERHRELMHLREKRRREAAGQKPEYARQADPG